MNQIEAQKKRSIQNEYNLSYQYNTIKLSNIHIFKAPLKEKIVHGVEKNLKKF